MHPLLHDEGSTSLQDKIEKLENAVRWLTHNLASTNSWAARANGELQAGESWSEFMQSNAEHYEKSINEILE